jgi:hypothetical protein
VSYDTPPAWRPDRAFYHRLVQACERGMRLADFQPRKAMMAAADA